jgi:hypothetical protein
MDNMRVNEPPSLLLATGAGGGVGVASNVLKSLVNSPGVFAVAGGTGALEGGT